MISQKIGCVLLTFLVAILAGTFVAVLPISFTYAFIELRRIETVQLYFISNVWVWLKLFVEATYGAYVFGLFIGLPATLSVATCLSIVGVIKNRLPIFAAVFAFATSLSRGVFLEWQYLLCQCHSNLFGYVHLLPIVYLSSYVFLAFGTWYMMRSIWRKAIVT